MSSVTKLPVLTLPHPLLLLPSARLTLSVSRNIGDGLLALVEQESPNILVALPTISPATKTADPILSEHGTAARVLRLVRSGNRGTAQAYQLTIAGLARVQLEHPLEVNNKSSDSLNYASVLYAEEDRVPSGPVVAAFKSAALNLLDKLIKPGPRKEQYDRLMAMIEGASDHKVGALADALVGTVDSEFVDKHDILLLSDVDERLKRTSELLIKLASISEITNKIAYEVEDKLSKQQKEFFLRQQLAAIQKELQSLGKSSRTITGSDLDDEDGDVDELAEVKRKIEAMAQGSEERKTGVAEYRRLKRIPSGSAENGVIRNYLEWLTSIPWPSTTDSSTASVEILKDRQFLAKARQQLDADHYGLDKIKKRLIEYLAVVRLKELAADVALSKALILKPEIDDSVKSVAPAKRTIKGPILLLVGPPGTGKTSISASLARSLGRPFQRVSLGGVRDEAEIRGHRRTYVASGPGAIVQAMKKAGRPDPVLLLDEIDKVGHNNMHGDPSAALLEVLDPEQNHSFRDHYINIPIDLSQVLFICTANTLETISAPLLDRCEVIHLSGYTYDEKLHIAKRFLLPKQLDANGLAAANLALTEPALLRIATGYTREAGVRSLERAIGAVVRYKAVQWADHSDHDTQTAYTKEVQEEELETILGLPRWDGDEKDREERRGVVYGLVVSGLGEGGILPVETCTIPGKGELRLTGSLGDVIKESSSLALSWVKTHAYDLCITSSRAQDLCKVPDLVDIHLHLPAGAQKKDGPSAGIAMVCAFVSLFTGACVPANIAMTGEITLRGRVDPVGGIKEKVLGAHRANVTKVILPYVNRKDVDQDVPVEVKNQMEFVFVKTIEEALEAAFGPGTLEWRRTPGLLIESRL